MYQGIEIALEATLNITNSFLKEVKARCPLTRTSRINMNPAAIDLMLHEARADKIIPPLAEVNPTPSAYFLGYPVYADGSVKSFSLELETDFTFNLVSDERASS